ncbi:hypothetical protein HCN44_009628 [Aphidius gifuensis]|uniref:Guided entry of tail-anchored proteins factor 1 n=1 Tax=Aphidius gifuensis TaxID=684658 RepID=A0A834Y4Z0_APHGI|nr:guided entry of tail-anchored proteins factor 1-like [Aphidius gifuensis]KAF7998230.1 hypothetical protein HCN44_009628 [Aphidius gifuensis]
MNYLLIISTFLCMFSHIIPITIKYIVSWIYSESQEERNLRKSILKLEQDLSKISMVDEFAKYTKIQRNHTKLREDMKKATAERTSMKTKSNVFFTYGTKVFNIVVVMVMMQLYRSEPVIILPKGSLWPLENILSWPSTYDDSISLFSWMAVTKLVMSKVFNK